MKRFPVQTAGERGKVTGNVPAGKRDERPAILRACLGLKPPDAGTIKQAMNAGYFLCKRLAAVRAEMSLTVLAYNLKRVVNILGVAALMKAMKAAPATG